MCVGVDVCIPTCPVCVCVCVCDMYVFVYMCVCNI